MRNRGPDYERIENISERILFGHQRLSIQDLSNKGNQPFRYKNFSMVFNGEIYNFKELKSKLENEGFKFQSQSDTEVLIVGLAEKGVKFLNNLNGMFAIAFYDDIKNTLILARDRFGVKPLYYQNI